MKTRIFLFTTFVFALSSCTKLTDENLLDVRAQALGFETADAYVKSVQSNCSQGNHENCNILANGEHRICNNVNHEGRCQNGEHYNGERHGNCGQQSKNCGSRNQGNRGGNGCGNRGGNRQ
jgi:hypothetical protein